MDFSYSASELMLKETVRRYCRENSARCHGQASQSDTLLRWAAMGELGWLQPCFEKQSGEEFSLSPLIIAEELGRALVLAPYWSCAVLAGSMLASCDANTSLISDLSGGRRLVATSFRNDSEGVLTTATIAGSRKYRLNGRQLLLVGGPTADAFLIPARLGCGRDETFALFLVDSRANRLKTFHYVTVDGGLASDLVLDDVELSEDAMIGRCDDLNGLCHIAFIALSAELVGIMDNVVSTCREHLLVRRQYGSPLSSYQALQHRMAEMFVELELSRSILYSAIRSLALMRAEERKPAVYSAYYHICKSGDFVCRNGVQLHGAMGMTEDYIIGRCFKRSIMISRCMGSLDKILDDITSSI
ncbi:acyl-CoA dehydrogenase [Agrobacterium leguminum]|uniref:Acyl-CoA dehydrogenase n=1 Tax=Agrobacterium deltaense NCPPB 1641 TaxID=1183425 RepID=A0A1S7TRW7_9HYPH|nr:MULTISPECIES: acyl-CoA dehydrogenase [Agrobacterium]WFS69314.1 acyl-CoA dehydrogenase [Agrobacterium leguminum]CVI57336.1 putative Acyl-CoA dehydrogenase [Agrobacterium deltaense NCPPB 1641]